MIPKTMKTQIGSSNTVPVCTITRACWQFLSLLAILALSLLSVQKSWASSGMSIAEIYGGGGNASSTYTNDYVVVFNRSATNIDVNGWSVQYASAGGNSWQVATLATSSRIVAPGGYFLVKMAAGTGPS